MNVRLPPRLPRLASGRPAVVLGLIGLATFAMICRAAWLQVYNADFLQGQGKDRYMRVMEVPASRGMIVDRHGDPLAVSSPVDSVWADPTIVLEHRHRLPALATLLEADAARLTARLDANATRQFLYLRRHMTPDAAARVLALGVPGVYVEREYRRFYPTGEVTSHLLGFTDIDDRGQEGLELVFDAQLRGLPGSKRVIRDRFGRVVENVEHLRAPQPGQTVALSIDRRIQYLAYRALKGAVLEHQASAATAAVMDVSTGEILALVNQPAGNPNNRSELGGGLLRNRAWTDVFEPGSTVKPFTVAAALESGLFRASTPVDTRPGTLRVGRNTVRDVRNFGELDVARVITKSSNVGVARMALAMPREHLWGLFAELGFGRRTELNMLGEQSGTLNHFSRWNDFEYATHSFGYGLSVTALQLLQAYAVLGADGVRRPMTLTRLEGPPPGGDRIMSAETARIVRAMMETVVSREGTAFAAAVPGYRVGGKTGTVRKIVNGRYSTDHYQSLFAGIAPISEPRLAMVVMVDDAQGRSYYGGRVAAPVFAEVMAGALRLLNVSPDGTLTGNMELLVQRERRP